MPDHAILRALLADDPVVVTGAGSVCVAGAGTEALWEAVRTARPGGAWHSFPAEGRSLRLPAAAVGELPRHVLSGKVDRSVSLGVAAAMEAWHESGAASVPAEEAGVVAGTSRGPFGTWMETSAALRRGRAVPPRFAAAGTLAALSGAVAMLTGARGPAMTVSATCASGAAAIAAAAEMLVLRRARAVLAGAAEAPLHAGVLSGMDAAGLLGAHDDAARACRPFDRTRNGLLAGEGAAFLVLERASHARARGAPVLGVLSGWATAAEGEGRAGVGADGRALARVVSSALAVAGVAPGDVDYINAHGTGTVLNDAAEAAALRAVFPHGVPPVSSTKAVTGHCLGASPALEAVICLRALRHGWLPASVNLVEPDAPLPFVTGSGRAAPVTHAVSTSLASGAATRRSSSAPQAP
jgi:3-oxoacyl-[acyl-carrier-protein] synthase II